MQICRYALAERPNRSPEMSSALPTGVVTYLFTDIEGSTRLVSRVGDRFGGLLSRHHELIRSSLATNSGHELRTEGDSFFAVFTNASDAVTAAIDAQRDIASDPELAAEGLAVRMGLHSGEAKLGGDNYTGLNVHLAARVSAAANGRQILVTDEVAAASATSDVGFRPLGEYWLKDIEWPVSLQQVVADGLEPEPGAPSAAPSHPVNAPVDLSSFVGRESDIERAISTLGSDRIVTLTGPGGTGKTRLAIEVGTKLSRLFPDGTFFVPLAGISEADSVPNSIIDALGAPMADPSSSPIDNLCLYLRHRKTLIITDNFEHVLTGAIHIEGLLEASPDSRVLATSRAPLGIRGERELAIAPLDVDTAAVQLFSERARSVRSSFVLDDTNTDAVRSIVGRLDGLPLAIELAAARIRMMSPEAILETLDPLALSGRGSQDREVTLADTIRWSYELLEEPEQCLLARMGVFPTGADFTQINEVCQPSADLGVDPFAGLGALVDHSLLVGDETGASPRFRMLETIREFAVRRLAESPDEQYVRDRHARAYLALVEDARPHLDLADSAKWMAVLATENANIQVALDHALEVQDADAAQRIVASAWRFWQSRGHLAEGFGTARAALALDGSTALVRAEALDAAGSIAYWTGDAEATRSYYEAAIRIRREEGSTAGLANALYNLSFPVADADGLEAATVILDEAIELATAGEDQRVLSLSYAALSRSWLDTSPELSREYAQKAIDGAIALDDPISEAWATSLHAAASHGLGNHATSTRYLQRALTVFVEHEDLTGIALDLAGIAESARRMGNDAFALYLVGAVSSLREESGIGVRTAIDGTVNEFSTAEAIAALPDDLRATYERGRIADLDDAIGAALAWDPGTTTE